MPKKRSYVPTERVWWMESSVARQIPELAHRVRIVRTEPLSRTKWTQHTIPRMPFRKRYRVYRAEVFHHPISTNDMAINRSDVWFVVEAQTFKNLRHFIAMEHASRTLDAVGKMRQA